MNWMSCVPIRTRGVHNYDLVRGVAVLVRSDVMASRDRWEDHFCILQSRLDFSSDTGFEEFRMITIQPKPATEKNHFYRYNLAFLKIILEISLLSLNTCNGSQEDLQKLSQLKKSSIQSNSGKKSTRINCSTLAC